MAINVLSDLTQFAGAVTGAVEGLGRLQQIRAQAEAGRIEAQLGEVRSGLLRKIATNEVNLNNWEDAYSQYEEEARSLIGSSSFESASGLTERILTPGDQQFRLEIAKEFGRQEVRKATSDMAFAVEMAAKDSDPERAKQRFDAEIAKGEAVGLDPVLINELKAKNIPAINARIHANQAIKANNGDLSKALISVWRNDAISISEKPLAMSNIQSVISQNDAMMSANIEIVSEAAKSGSPIVIDGVAYSTDGLRSILKENKGISPEKRAEAEAALTAHDYSVEENIAFNEFNRFRTATPEHTRDADGAMRFLNSLVGKEGFFSTDAGKKWIDTQKDEVEQWWRAASGEDDPELSAIKARLAAKYEMVRAGTSGVKNFWVDLMDTMRTTPKSASTVKGYLDNLYAGEHRKVMLETFGEPDKIRDTLDVIIYDRQQYGGEYERTAKLLKGKTGTAQEQARAKAIYDEMTSSLASQLANVIKYSDKPGEVETRINTIIAAHADMFNYWGRRADEGRKFNEAIFETQKAIETGGIITSDVVSGKTFIPSGLAGIDKQRRDTARGLMDKLKKAELIPADIDTTKDFKVTESGDLFYEKNGVRYDIDPDEKYGLRVKVSGKGMAPRILNEAQIGRQGTPGTSKQPKTADEILNSRMEPSASEVDSLTPEQRAQLYKKLEVSHGFMPRTFEQRFGYQTSGAPTRKKIIEGTTIHTTQELGSLASDQDRKVALQNMIKKLGVSAEELKKKTGYDPATGDRINIQARGGR